MTSVSGVHWDPLTSDMYVYGSHVLHSSTRGVHSRVVLTLGDGDTVQRMGSGPSGDVLAVSG